MYCNICKCYYKYRLYIVEFSIDFTLNYNLYAIRFRKTNSCGLCLNTAFPDAYIIKIDEIITFKEIISEQFRLKYFLECENQKELEFLLETLQNNGLNKKPTTEEIMLKIQEKEELIKNNKFNKLFNTFINTIKAINFKNLRDDVKYFIMDNFSENYKDFSINLNICENNYNSNMMYYNR